MDIAFWAVVAVGAVTLIIEASRRFAEPVELQPHDRYPILNEVNLDALCTRGELIRGFMIYVTLYLGAYGTILTSAELFDLISNPDAPTAAQVQETRDFVAGARDTEDDIQAVEEPDGRFALGKPLLISAAIISALSIGIFAPIERILRGYAHWIAAIPRGVYRVISRLKRADYAAFAKKREGPLVEAFTTFADAHPDFDKDIRAELTATLRAIDVLQPATTGSDRDQYFSAYIPPIIAEQIGKKAEEVAELRAAVEGLKKEADAIGTLQFQAATVCNNIQALFALLFIHNHKTVEVSRLRNPTARLIEYVISEREPAQHALTGAVISMAVAVMVLHPVIYLSINTAPSLLDSGFHVFILNQTLLSLVQFVFLFGICASTAMLSREASAEYGRWPEYTLSRIPFLVLFQHALFPGFAAVAFCVVVRLLAYPFEVNEDGSLEQYVRDNWQFCVMHFVFGFVIAIVIFLVIDQHEQLKAKHTVTLAMLAVVPYVLWAIYLQSLYGHLNCNPDGVCRIPHHLWMLREVLLLSTPAIGFALAFALLLEWAEEDKA